MTSYRSQRLSCQMKWTTSGSAMAIPFAMNRRNLAEDSKNFQA